jgi:hypothetical protein
MSKAAFVSNLFAVCLVMSATSCMTSSGEGFKAKRGYKAATPIIVALDKFHEERGYYPDDLNQLVPAYLPAKSLILPQGLTAGIQRIETSRSSGFGYENDSDSYSLNFSYIGPGINYCFYDSKTKKWTANSYY